MWKEDFFSYSRKKIYTIGYTIKCIGHHHCFYDTVHEEGSKEMFGQPKKDILYEAILLKE